MGRNGRTLCEFYLFWIHNSVKIVPTVNVPFFDRDAYEAELWGRATNLESIKRASALILNTDPVACRGGGVRREVCVVADPVAKCVSWRLAIRLWPRAA